MSSNYSALLECIHCGYELRGRITSSCPRCGGVLAFKYESPAFRVERGERSIHRYSSMLPKFSRRVSLGEGLTPISRVENVLVKNERFNPTGSYSDRASAIIASYLKTVGVSDVSIRYFPDFARSLVQYLRDFNVEIVVDSVFDVELDEISLFASKGLSVVTSSSRYEVVVDYVNPLTIEGLKTIAFELFEKNVAADYIVVPAETGLLALSIYKGLRDLRDAGIEFSSEVVAATLRGSRPPLLRNVGGIKVVEASSEEIYESFKRLTERGFKVKPIVALSYQVASALGRSIAIVTMGFKPSARRDRSAVKQLVLEVLSSRWPLTAYEVWRERPIYTLRAVYKAVRDMELRGEICFEAVNRNKRRVKLYRPC